jgi:hypothetical protein
MNEIASRMAQRPRLETGGERMNSDRKSSSVTPPPESAPEESHKSLLAEAMSSSTFEEHQSAIHDLHGVSEVPEDDPK